MNIDLKANQKQDQHLDLDIEINTNKKRIQQFNIIEIITYQIEMFT